MKKLIAILTTLFIPTVAYSAKQTINNGETMGQARTKINSNFTEVYTQMLTGDCTVGPCLDGTSDGGTLIKLYGPGTYWTALQAGNALANRSWRLPIDAPPSAGTTRLMNMDEYGQMGFVDPATFATPTGSAASMTVVATGFDGNLATTDNTLQEIAQKLDDLVLGSGSVSDSAYGVGWNGDTTTAPSKNAIYDKIETLAGGHDAVTLGTDADVIFGLSAQQITLDSQTANYVFAAPNGSPGDPTFRALVAADIPTLNQNTTGSAAILTTARTIGGVSFDGSANINLPGVNTTGNQNTSGTAAGLSGTPNITVGTVSAGAAGFSVDADGDVTAKSVTVTRTTSPTSLRFYEGTGGGNNYIDLTLSGNLAGDSTVNLDQIITTASFDDTPDNDSMNTGPTSNWAYDHAADTAIHNIAAGTSPTVDAAGEMSVDTTSDQFVYYGGAKRVLTYKKQFDFAIKTPTDADDVLLFKAQTAITITDIHVIAQGGTSISVDIQECDSAGANCATVDAAITADTDGAEDDGTLSNGTIDAGDWVKLVLGAPSGTVNFLTGSIYYVETAN
jgi:hypothetical protein